MLRLWQYSFSSIIRLRRSTARFCGGNDVLWSTTRVSASVVVCKISRSRLWSTRELCGERRPTSPDKRSLFDWLCAYLLVTFSLSRTAATHRHCCTPLYIAHCKCDVCMQELSVFHAIYRPPTWLEITLRLGLLHRSRSSKVRSPSLIPIESSYETSYYWLILITSYLAPFPRYSVR